MDVSDFDDLEAALVKQLSEQSVSVSMFLRDADYRPALTSAYGLATVLAARFEQLHGERPMVDVSCDSTGGGHAIKVLVRSWDGACESSDN